MLQIIPREVLSGEAGAGQALRLNRDRRAPICTEATPYDSGFSPLLTVAGRLLLRMRLLHLGLSDEFRIIRLLTRFATKLPLNDQQPRGDVVAVRSNVSQFSLATAAPRHTNLRKRLPRSSASA